MLQRNDTPYRWNWTGDAPFAVLPGETTDHPVLLDGWTAVEDEPAQEPEAESARATTRSKRAAAADTDGGEPQ